MKTVKMNNGSSISLTDGAEGECLRPIHPPIPLALQRVYIAGAYARKYEFRAHADLLRQLGVEVMSSWLDEPDDPDTHLRDVPWERQRAMSVRDIQQIGASNALIAFAEPEDSPHKRGGRHVEFGVALALQKAIYLIGKPECTFHHLAGRQYPHVSDFIAENFSVH